MTESLLCLGVLLRVCVCVGGQCIQCVWVCFCVLGLGVFMALYTCMFECMCLDLWGCFSVFLHVCVCFNLSSLGFAELFEFVG